VTWTVGQYVRLTAREFQDEQYGEILEIITREAMTQKSAFVRQFGEKIKSEDKAQVLQDEARVEMMRMGVEYVLAISIPKLRGTLMAEWLETGHFRIFLTHEPLEIELIHDPKAKPQ